MDPQGSVANAKEDTVLLVLTSVADLWIDLSQYADDLVEDAGAYEDPSPLRALTGETGRELYVQATIEPADVDSILLIHADPADPTAATYAIYLNSSGDLEFRQGAVALLTVTLTIAVDSLISAHWSTRPNPDTVGASTALISEVIVYDHTAGAYVAILQMTHAVATTSTSWALGVGGYWDGAAMILANTPVSRCRIGKAWHTSVEFAEDWIGARPAHSTTLTVPEYLLPIDQASGLGDEGQWTGQANVGWIAEDNARKRWSLWTNLVNETYTDTQEVQHVDWLPEPWSTQSPGGGTYCMRLDFLRWVAVPRGATHVWVRVHVVSYSSSTAVPVQVCCVAMNRPPFGVGPLGGEAFAFARAESEVLTVDQSSTAVGQWLTLGLLRLPIYQGNTPGWRDTVHLVLGWRFDPLGVHASPEDGRLKIRSWWARPTFKAIGGPLGG